MAMDVTYSTMPKNGTLEVGTMPKPGDIVYYRGRWDIEDGPINDSGRCAPYVVVKRGCGLVVVPLDNVHESCKDGNVRCYLYDPDFYFPSVADALRAAAKVKREDAARMIEAASWIEEMARAHG